MARPSKYTPEAVARIIQALELGATYEHAAAYGGISYDTFNAWRQEFSEFSEALKAAEARAVYGWLDKIERAAESGNWQAAAWKLEWRHPDQWGRREKVELSTRREAERIAQEQGLDAAELIALAERIAAGKG